jgi:hypothetical protein
MKKIIIAGLVLVVVVIVAFFVVPPRTVPIIEKEPATVFPVSPLDATYNIEDVGVTLTNGSASLPAAPGSATTVDTKVFGQPVMGDLDGDGDNDAAVLLQQDPGGTGMFYYLAAAINTGNGYRGTNALFLGDRIAPQDISIGNGIVVANYADRGPNEPFSVKPSIGKSLYGQILKNQLTQIEVAGQGVQVAYGFVTYGGEVRTFSPCGAGSGEWWVMGDSPAYKEIFDAAKKLNEIAPKPYTPVFAVLVGKVVSPPKDGFGADYKQGFYASQLVKLVPQGSCN